MPRRPRYLQDGDLHHVILRGHSGSPIVTCHDDATKLLEAIAERFEKELIRVWSWTAVTNHLHLLLRAAIEAISLSLRDAVAPYARRMNLQLGGRGSFFQDRFWSKPVGDEAYAQTCVVYIGRNAHTAGHVSSVAALETHRLSGYGALLGRAPSLLPMDIEGALGLFGADQEAARRALRAQMADAVARWDHDKCDSAVDAILRVVAGELGVPPDVLRSRSKHSFITDARVEVVRRSIAMNIKQSDVARALGVSRQAVSLVVKKLLSVPTARRADGWTMRFEDERQAIPRP